MPLPLSKERTVSDKFDNPRTRSEESMPDRGISSGVESNCGASKGDLSKGYSNVGKVKEDNGIGAYLEG